jgi:hypothetical protein
VDLPERGDRVVSQMLIGGKAAKGHFVVSGALQLTRTPLAYGIAVDQKTDQENRMVSGLAAAILARMGIEDGAQIESVNDIGDKAGQVAFGQPVLEEGGRRKG